MGRILKGFYVCLYFGIVVAIVMIAMGFEHKLFAGEEVIKTFEAGPIKEPKKKVGRVKTNFNWSKEGVCPCVEGKGPCIQSFLDKRVSQPGPKFPSMIEDYYIQNRIGSEYQGAGQVPWGVDFASVRILNIPFCGQERRGVKKSTK